MQTDLEIARGVEMKHITKIAERLGVNENDIEMYGKYKAKLPLHLIDEEKIKKHHLVLVTALTPTPAGEGKTTMTIAITEGLNKIGKLATSVTREPSLGPVFGIKGGAAGGGHSQVVPMEDINLHFTGDFAAIEKANNLLAALIDNNLQNKKGNLNIDPRTIVWKRVFDMNDRSLRNIVIGLGGSGNGIPREDSFNITAASEVMAILCMSNNMSELKEKLGNIFIAYTFDKKPIYAKDLKAQGAMALLLKDAIKPNLVQTLEGNPSIIHGGPFANIAQGTNTIIATKMGLSLSDYVITEAGFGADLGAEKFFDLKCASAGLKPEATALVATIRALRHHGGAEKAEYNTPSVERVEKGFANLAKHIENVQKFGIKPVVVINYFPTDTQEEIDLTIKLCAEKGVKAVVCKGFEKGGEGARDVAQAIVEAVESGNNQFKTLYNWNQGVEEKISKIAQELYGAKEVSYTEKARKQLKTIYDLGLDKIGICMAKTEKSFTDDAKIKGCPKDFTITVREFEFAAGAGYVIPILGVMMRMPGLPSIPASEAMDIDDNGIITGLS